MERDEKDINQKQSDDKVIFMPLEEIRSIERVLDNMEMICEMFRKVAKEMKPVEN